MLRRSESTVKSDYCKIRIYSKVPQGKYRMFVKSIANINADTGFFCELYTIDFTDKIDYTSLQ